MVDLVKKVRKMLQDVAISEKFCGYFGYKNEQNWLLWAVNSWEH